MDWIAKLNNEIPPFRAKFLTAVGGIEGRFQEKETPLVAQPIPEKKCWLDDKGRLRIRGLPPKDIDRLDLLLQLNASDEEIEHHIHPLGTPFQWERWEKIKEQRSQ